MNYESPIIMTKSSRSYAMAIILYVKMLWMSYPLIGLLDTPRYKDAGFSA